MPEGNSVDNLANKKICTPNNGTSAAGTDVTNKSSFLSHKDSDIAAPKVSNAIDQSEETVNNKSKTPTSVKERNVDETPLGSSSSKSNQQLQMTKKDNNNNPKSINGDSSKIGQLFGKQITDRTTNVHEKEGNQQVAPDSQDINVSPSVVDSRDKESATDTFGHYFNFNHLANLSTRYNACDRNIYDSWFMGDGEIPETQPVNSYPWEKKEGNHRELEKKTPTTSGLSRKVVNNEDMTVAICGEKLLFLLFLYTLF